MNKEINLIKKVFEVSYPPLTCNILYSEPWDVYYLNITENCHLLYNPERFTPCLKFYLNDDKSIMIDEENLFSPFDNFIPNLSQKIKIFVKMGTSNIYGVEPKTFEIVERKRLHREDFDSGFYNVSVSGCTSLNLVR